jgi:hypothetical protein
MDGLLALHVTSSRFLYGKAFSPRLGLPQEGTTPVFHVAARNLTRYARLFCLEGAPASAAQSAKKSDGTHDMMSLAMVIAGLYGVAQSVGGEAKSKTTVTDADPLVSFDTAENLVRFHRYPGYSARSPNVHHPNALHFVLGTLTPTCFWCFSSNPIWAKQMRTSSQSCKSLRFWHPFRAPAHEALRITGFLTHSLLNPRIS